MICGRLWGHYAVKTAKPPVKASPQRTAQAFHIQQIHTGPLPAPSDYADYDSVLPGSAERILRMAEEEQTHRHVIEIAAAKDNRLLIIERRIGQFMAFLVTLSCLGLGVWLVVSGFPVIGTIFGGVGLAPVIWAFIPKKK